MISAPLWDGCQGWVALICRKRLASEGTLQVVNASISESDTSRASLARLLTHCCRGEAGASGGQAGRQRRAAQIAGAITSDLASMAQGFPGRKGRCAVQLPPDRGPHCIEPFPRIWRGRAAKGKRLAVAVFFLSKVGPGMAIAGGWHHQRSPPTRAPGKSLAGSTEPLL